jgi:spore coat protein U-like protein
MRGAGTMTQPASGLLRLLCAAALVLLCTGRADAANCSIATTSIAFGNYDVFSASPTDTTGSVSFTCNATASIAITLSKGSSPTFSRRRLNGPPPDTLNYNLYLDVARTTVWGDGTASTATYTNTNPPVNTQVVVTIYGRIPAGQDVSAGTYTDTITATINF